MVHSEPTWRPVRSSLKISDVVHLHSGYREACSQIFNLPMQKDSRSYVGIDPTAGRHPFTFAALDQERQLISLAAGNVDDALAFLSETQAVTVAVNSPP